MKGSSVLLIALLKLTLQISAFRETLGFEILGPRHMTGGLPELGKGVLQKGSCGWGGRQQMVLGQFLE